MSNKVNNITVFLVVLLLLSLLAFKCMVMIDCDLSDLLSGSTVEDLNKGLDIIYNAKTIEVEKRIFSTTADYESFNLDNFHALNIYDEFTVSYPSEKKVEYSHDDEKIVAIHDCAQSVKDMISQYTPKRNENIEEYLKKNNLNTEKDILSYLHKKRLHRNNVFTSLPKMLENRMDYYLAIIIGADNYLEYYNLSDNYVGFIYSITENNYVISLNNDYKLFTYNMSLEEIINFLSYTNIEE